jgi:hypothetical protein
MNKPQFLLLLLCFLALSCEQSPTEEKKESLEELAYEAPANALFQKLEEEETQISFRNVLRETEAFNYYNYTYMYNGSGVAVADFNNDGLLDLFFVGAMSSNKLYLNMGDLRFKDVTAAAGVAGPNVLKTGVAVHDVNEDGYMDIYVCHSGLSSPAMRTNALYINNQDGTFSEEAVTRGVDDQSHTNHALFFDYDNDNDLDLFLLNHPIDFTLINNMSLKQKEDGTILRDGTPGNQFEGDRLFENIGQGQFKEVSEEAGIFQKAYGLSVTPMDINEDGWMDLYVGNDFIEPDFLYINRKDGTFIDSIDAYFPHTSNNTMGADAGDINNDGRLDFMSLDMLPEGHYRQKTLMTSMRYDRYKQLEKYNYGRQIMRNTLFVKGSDGKMRDVACFAGVDATDWSWSPLIADFDGDGFKDIFITNGYRRDLTDLDYMTYYDEKVGRTSLPEDNVEALLDEVPIHPVHNYIYRNRGDLTFESSAKEWGLGEPVFSNGALHADLDNDGDLDLVVNNFDMPTFIYKNRSKELTKHRDLRIRLNGPKGNIEGIGAQIRVYAGEQIQHQNVQRIKGFMSYSSAIAHFGMGQIQQADSVVVRWPDGKVQRLQEVPTNQLLTLNYSAAGSGVWPKLSNARPFLISGTPVDFTHNENEFIDLKREPLLPRAYSRRGPIVEVLDFNRDGREDFFVGGARGQASALFIQQADGAFQSIAKEFFAGEAQYEDVAVGLGDFNGDGWPDLYVGSGGYSELKESFQYRDRLYINEEGRSLRRQQLPPRQVNTGAVTVADFNQDGQMDIIVAGYLTPDQYPHAPASYILINNNGKLEDQTDQWWPDGPMESAISTALSIDLSGNGYDDLLVAGEWMPLTLWPNSGERFLDPIKVPDSEGWWNTLEASQLNESGETHILAGNFGENTRWRATPEEPIEVFAADFDQSGRHTPLLTHYMQGERVPVARRDALMELMPSLRSRYVKFSTYAEARIEDLVDIEGDQVLHRKASTLKSGYLPWSAAGPGSWKAFPMEAQWSSIHAFATADLTGNGLTDIIFGGNDFELEIESARMDANSIGVLLQVEKNQWKFVPQEGLPGRFNRELRSMKVIEVSGAPHLIVGWKEHPVEIFALHLSEREG